MCVNGIKTGSKHVCKLLASNRNVLADCFYAIHTHQLEFANTSLPTLVCRVKAAYDHKWWNRELTLKCKLKCYVKPMKYPLGVSPSKGNKGTTRGKEKIILTSVGIVPDFLCPTSSKLSRQSNGRSNPEVVGSIPTEVKKIFSLPRVVP